MKNSVSHFHLEIRIDVSWSGVSCNLDTIIEKSAAGGLTHLRLPALSIASSLLFLLHKNSFEDYRLKIFNAISCIVPSVLCTIGETETEQTARDAYGKSSACSSPYCTILPCGTCVDQNINPPFLALISSRKYLELLGPALLIVIWQMASQHTLLIDGGVGLLLFKFNFFLVKD